MTVINTNIKSLIAQQAVTVNERAMSKAMQQLSTGKRINTASDDAAGLAISDRMTAQIRGLNQAVRNANDGISMLQTIDGATVEVSNMLQRMSELAVQSANGTYASADRTALDEEYAALSDQIAQIADQTTWNGFNVGNSAASYTFQVGTSSSATISISLQDINDFTASAGDISTQSGGSDAISTVASALTDLNSYRSTLGATMNRLTYTADNLANIATNTAASRSRILDTDYAQATTELARTQIIQQAATAMLAQANQSNQTVLTLLRG